MNGKTVLTPALSSKEREKRSLPWWKYPARDGSENRARHRNYSPSAPLLGGEDTGEGGRESK